MKIYKRFLASYLCVCLVPLLLSFVTIARLESRVQDSILEDQESSMLSVRQDIDQTLGHAANLVSIFSEDALVSRLSEKSSLEVEELFSLCDLSESLSRAIGQNSAFYRGFCYLARSGFLITDRRTYHPESSDLFPWDLRLTRDSFYSLLDSGSATEHITTVYKDPRSAWIMVLRSQYGSRSKELISCVGIVIKLDKSLSRWNSENFEAFVTDDAYNLVYGGDHAPAACEILSGRDDESGEIKLDDQRYVYSQYQSSLGGVRYGFLARRDQYYQELRIVWIHLIAEIAVILIVSALLVFFWSRHTYRPIKNILPYVETGSPEAEPLSISQLGTALVSFAQEKENLATQVVQSEQQVRSAALSQYLLGLTEDPSLLSQYLEEGQPYQLLAFAPAGDAVSDPSLIRALRERLDDMLLDERGGVSLQFRRCAVVLLQDTLSSGEAEELNSAVERSLSMPAACYVSEACTRLEEAPAAWAAVYGALRRDRFWSPEGRRGVRPVSGQDRKDSSQPYREFLSRQKALTEYLSAGKRQRAEGCLEKILSEDLSDMTLPVEKLQRRYDDVAELILPYLAGDQAQEVMGRFRQYETAREMEEGLRALFGQVSWGPKAGMPEMKRELTQNVQSFIRANYRDQSLNASMIADHLDMNLSTLSHQYKAATGSGLLDELHAVRLESAKELLTQGASVREAAERSGYADQRALIRAFKRYEGITPGQYAKGGAQS